MDGSKLLAAQSLVPVVVIEDASCAVPLVEVLLEAGIGAIEITLRTEAALSAIEQVASKVPEIIVGVGSVRDASHFPQVVDAGARFAVSPGATDALLEAADVAKIPFVPGAATASEMLKLREHGYTLQKLFPAEVSGGIPMIKAVSAPIPDVRFFPTGGVNLGNVRDYLALDCVSCVGGSWFVSQKDLAAGDYKAISLATQQAVAAINLG